MPDIDQTDESAQPSRRTILGGFSKITLSAGALGLLGVSQGSRASRAAADPIDAAGDSVILNVALGLEHAAVVAYQFSAESGLLQPEILEVAMLFQGHHKGHRDVLAATIEQLGGTPVAAKSDAAYAVELGQYPIADQDDILALARTLELQAANAYLGVIPDLADENLAKVAARIAADETMHWATLAHVTGQPLPAAALSLGA